MLLKDLTKHTEKDHADYGTLHQAWEAIEKVAVYIEEKAEEADNFHMVSSIQARFSNKAENLVCVGRKYVRQGELEMVTSKSKTRRPRWFILFSDALVEAKKNRSDSKMGSLLGRKRSMTLGAASLSKDLTFKRIYNLKTIRARDDEDKSNYCILLDNMALGETVLKLYAPNKLTKFEWLNDFNAIRAKIDLDKRQREAAIRNTTQSMKLKRAISQQTLLSEEEQPGQEDVSKDPRKRLAASSAPTSSGLEKSQSCRNLMSGPPDSSSLDFISSSSAPSDSALRQLESAKKDRQKSGGHIMGRLHNKARNSYDARSMTLRTEKEKDKEKERERRAEKKEKDRERRRQSLLVSATTSNGST